MNTAKEKDLKSSHRTKGINREDRTGYTGKSGYSLKVRVKLDRKIVTSGHVLVKFIKLFLKKICHS